VDMFGAIVDIDTNVYLENILLCVFVLFTSYSCYVRRIVFLSDRGRECTVLSLNVFLDGVSTLTITYSGHYALSFPNHSVSET
jgi:hypothetical protein